MAETASAGEAKVEIKLVVNDQTADTVRKMREGMQSVSKDEKDVKKDAEGIAEGVVKGEIHFETMKQAVELTVEAVRQGYELTEKLADAAVEAAQEATQQEKAMRGLFGLMDGGVHTSEQLARYAKSTREELEMAGLQQGVATKDMVDLFDTIVERGTMSTEKAKELAGAMALVGKAVPGGASSLAEGLNAVELGIIRARNPLVQLIASTHLLKGNAASVAQQMQHMTPAHQMELATKAIEKQAELMKKSGSGTPLGLTGIETQLSTVRESFLEQVGQPIVQHLVAGLSQVSSYLIAHIEEIKKFGHQVGQEMARMVDAVGTIFSDVFGNVRSNWTEISEAVGHLSLQWRMAWVFARDNAHLIAAALSGIIIGGAKIINTAAHAFQAAADEIESVLEKLPGIGHAIDEHRAQKAQDQLINEQSYVVGPGSDKAWLEASQKYEDAKAKAGEDFHAGLAEAWQQHEAALARASMLTDSVQNKDFGKWQSYVDAATRAHHESEVEYAVGLMENSEDLQKAFASGAVKLGQGFDEFIDTIEEKHPELAEKLKKMSNVVQNEGGLNQSAHVYNYNTFNIKQDFKDQDPDRVMTLFRRDIVRAAQSRMQARVVTPFGL